MKTHIRGRGRLLARLLLLMSLLAGFGLLAGRAVSPAHAATTLIVTNCSNDSQLQADISQANRDNANDTITFACSGDIFTFGITISGSMTLDGSGHSVTLDGQNLGVGVLFVKSGVSFTLKALTIAHGSNFFGGAIDMENATLSISNSTFVNNSATSGLGGAILIDGGTVTISNSTFANNSATGSNSDGGAILNDNGTLSISNSTFTNNSSGGGGGLTNDNGTVTISNSTFANNSGAGNCSTAAPGSGGGICNFHGTVSIGGSIVANNAGGDCFNVYNATMTDQGYNLDSDSSCFTAATSQHGNPQLSALANNGGPTETLALQQGSPAIDAGPPSGLCPTTDQRGFLRPDDSESSCDIGAYESGAQSPDRDLGLTVPSNQTVDAASPQGASVTYQASATDESGDTSTATVSCTPASGSLFPIGTTTVTCAATDSDDTPSSVSASFTVTVNDTDLGLSNMPGNITVNATGPAGASVTYSSPTAVDEDSPLPTVSCDHAPGSTFAIGTTTVTCTVSDSDDTPSSVSQSFTVTVKDVTAPTLSLPSSPITVNATSSHGASVTYTVTANDPDNPSSQLIISCLPASGSTFAIGTTTVNCRATDPYGNSSSGSFQVVVNGAATQVNELIATGNSFHLSGGLQTALDAKLNATLKAVNAGQTATACSDLSDFIGQAQSQSGKGLTAAQANQLIASAKQVRAVLGC